MEVVLVTGAAGFIGSNLVRRLLSKGYTVIGVDNYITGLPRNVADISCQRWTFLNLDITASVDYSDIVKFVISKYGKLTYIYHMAGIASPPMYEKWPMETLDTCYIGTKNMLHLARASNARLLLASTSEVYGNPLETPQHETYYGNVNPVGRRSCYDEGKRISETLCHVARQRGVDTRIARIFNTFGPYMRFDDGRIVTNVLNAVLTQTPIEIYGTGEQTRCFLYIDDLLDGLETLMSSSITTPVNLGSENEITINVLVKTILELSAKHGLPSPPITFAPIGVDDPRRRRPNIDTARKLGWSPKTSLQEGLQKMLAYAVKNN